MAYISLPKEVRAGLYRVFHPFVFFKPGGAEVAPRTERFGAQTITSYVSASDTALFVIQSDNRTDCQNSPTYQLGFRVIGSHLSIFVNTNHVLDVNTNTPVQVIEQAFSHYRFPFAVSTKDNELIDALTLSRVVLCFFDYLASNSNSESVKLLPYVSDSFLSYHNAKRAGRTPRKTVPVRSDRYVPKPLVAPGYNVSLPTPDFKNLF